MPSARDLLQWVYLARVVVPIVVFVAAAFYFKALPPETILILAVLAITSVVVSSLSVWHTHIRGAQPGLTFLYAQALFDLALVTTVVHVTEGPDSQFPALYVAVIAVSAVLMPFASSLMITSLASLLYVADIVWFNPVQLTVVVWLQIAVFVGVFVVTGLIASRVRSIGAEKEELRKEVRRLKLEAGDILRNIRSGVVTVDGAGTVLFINEAARALLGLPAREDLVGLELARVAGDRSPDLVAAIHDTQTTGRRTMRVEGTVRTSEGGYPIGVTTTALDLEDGQPPSVTAIFSDISDQKRLEALHLRAERLEAVAELSSSLAHEIKNPLASIRSSVEQLASATRTNADERSLARLVVRESDRLSRLLSEFLDFSRVRVTNSRTVDLGRIAGAAVDMVRNHPDCSKGCEISQELAPAEIEGDEDLLHRVVVNLVLNAVQASRDGRVRVEVRAAGPDDMPAGVQLEQAVLLKVSDDGPGVPEELRDRLFDPFVTGRTGGSGLGLAIVQRAVEAHRGVVFLDDTSASGTSFSVLLPAAGAQEVA